MKKKCMHVSYFAFRNVSVATTLKNHYTIDAFLTKICNLRRYKYFEIQQHFSGPPDLRARNQNPLWSDSLNTCAEQVSVIGLCFIWHGSIQHVVEDIILISLWIKTLYTQKNPRIVLMSDWNCQGDGQSERWSYLHLFFLSSQLILCPLARKSS